VVGDFFKRGWACFPADPAIADWVSHAVGPACAAVNDPSLAQWHQCEGTWFVGLEALPNDPSGAVGGSGPLRGAVMDFIARHLAPVKPLHRAQISVIYPGYPRPRTGESEAAFGYRLRRDAAHVDGLLAVGPDRRRMLREPHGYILGLPLNAVDADAAPLVVWEGSHIIMRRAFRAAFTGVDPVDWREVDVTEAYQAARREVFETCTRVALPGAPGEACLVHRLTLHGVAPWHSATDGAPDGRMIAYFRPELSDVISGWLETA